MHATRGLTGLVALALVLEAPRPSEAQLTPFGPQFQVNTYTTGDQGVSGIASDSAGNVVLVWQSDGSAGTDTSSSSVQGQRYDTTGEPLGPEFQINSYTTGLQRGPDVDSDPAGSFVVVWESQDGPSPSTDRNVVAQRYDSSGAQIGGEFQVNTYTTNAQSNPSVAMDGAGNFVVVWNSAGSAGSDTSGSSMQAQRFDSLGAPVGGEFQVNTYTTADQYDSDLSVDAAGNFVVVWQSFGSSGSDASGASIQAQRYDSSGTPQGSEFQVNTYTTGDQSAPDVTHDAAGNFVVVWQSTGSPGSDTSSYSIQGQRFDASGTPLGAQFQVNTYTSGGQFLPSVSLDAAGDFVVVWDSYGSVGPDVNRSLQGQRYDSSGSPVGAQFQLNTLDSAIDAGARTAPDPAGTFIVAWTSLASAESDKSGQSIQAKRDGPARLRGRKLIVRNPPGGEPRRRVVVVAREQPTDMGPALVGDPTVTGATLRVVAGGGTSADETYVLDAPGWTPITGGYRYSGPTGADGDPVKRVILKRTPKGVGLLKAVLHGSIGTQSLDVVPPNPGDAGGIELTITGGFRHCVGFGAAAGGTEALDTATAWKVINPPGQGCP
jgi:hypothetical protein